MTDEAKALVDAVDRYVRVCTTGSSDGAKYRARKNLMGHIETQAREIERLRGVLKRWQYSGCPDCGGDCGSANPPVICCIMEETRAALAGDSHDQ